MPASTRQTALVWFAIAALALFSVGLALVRIYQVDEAQNLYMARLAMRGEGREFFTTAALHLIPLGWLAQQLSSSAAIFTAARLVFLVVFWLNIFLLTVATGSRLGSAAGAWVTLGAATLAPLWDYGIEVRHDNLLLSGILTMWILGRPADVYRPWRFVCIGLLTAALQFVAIKAVVFTAPVSLLALGLPGRAAVDSRARRAAAWAIGLVAGWICVRVLYGLTGLWDVYIASFRGIGTGLKHMAPSKDPLALGRLLSQAPLLLAGTLSALLVSLDRVRTHGLSAETWSHGLAEALLFIVALAAFLTNPTPFPYNLLLLVPFAYLLVVRVLRATLASSTPQRTWLPWIAGVLVFTHGVPFARASARHLAFDNTRQQDLMTMAEAVTDAKRDRVYDATGLVLTRRATQHWWYLHSLNMRLYGTKESPRLSEVLVQRPAAVVIRSYRTDWLPRADADFIEKHYVPLADDFWVLGTTTTSQVTWDCLLGGRYALQLGTARHMPVPSVFLDEMQVTPGVLTLRAGRHELSVRGTGQAALVWLGPRLQTPPRLTQSSHKRLFVNWY